MLKPMIAATAVLAIAGSSIAFAQRQDDDHDGQRGATRFERHCRPSVEDLRAFGEARIAALKAGLQLTPDQEKNWAPFESALRDMVSARLQRMQAHENRQSGDQQGTDNSTAGSTPEAKSKPEANANPFDRLQRRAEAMTERGTALKRVADAGTPLYQSLTDAQKSRFKILARMLRPHHMHAGFWRHEESGQDWRDGYDDGYWQHRGEERHGDMGRGDMGRGDMGAGGTGDGDGDSDD
jgi:hypothetical protein